jgi:hypothetical protein
MRNERRGRAEAVLWRQKSSAGVKPRIAGGWGRCDDAMKIAWSSASVEMPRNGFFPEARKSLAAACRTDTTQARRDAKKDQAVAVENVRV